MRTDTFASGYKSQKDQQIAEAVSNAVARALVAFYQESFAPARSPSPPKTPRALSYASVAKSIEQQRNQELLRDKQLQRKAPQSPLRRHVRTIGFSSHCLLPHS